MSERLSSKPEVPETSHPTLFEQLGPEGLINHLESQGIEVIPVEDDGEQRLSVHCPVGVYSGAVGLPEIKPSERRYFYGNLPPELQEHALELDINHPAFQRLLGELADTLHGNIHSVEQLVPALKAIIENNLADDQSDEHVRRLSEIVESGRTACAGMVTIGGLLAKSIAPTLSVTAITGSPLRFRDEFPLDFSHEWLRIADTKHIVLYDPLYQQLATYDTTSPSVNTNDPFEHYRVYAWGVAPLTAGRRLSISPNLEAVTRVGSEGYELWVAPESSMAVQILGKLPFATKTDGANFVLVNGNIELARNSQNRDSSRRLIPLLELNKRNE